MLDPEAGMRVGEETDGFVVRAVTPVEALRLTAIQLEHPASGAHLVHLSADDDENLFSVSFRTPPPDDCGVPHILEHAVLSGSRKFPVRDPFFEMAKMSMSTFLNAMTGPDTTYYPVASNVKQDLWNLADVYFDAVFHPLITERTFQREGHHLAPADPADPTGALTVNGIVYNEMKGAFSNPETRLYDLAGRGLFPDTPNGRESGGDPDAIPDLTYDGFKRFKQTYYHPSNALFCLYGNIPTREYTAFLAGRLADFERADVDAGVPWQPRWDRSRAVDETYPIGADEPDAAKTYFMLTWLVGDATDPADFTAMGVLDAILLGNEAALLKKPIIDSKLGEDLIFSGCDSVGREATFRVGLKGAEPDRAEAFEQLVTDTLEQIAAGPIDRGRVGAAFQQAAYQHLEIGSYYPLRLMMRLLRTWRHGGDPLAFLSMGEHLAACRRRHEGDEMLFSRLIRERMLDNPHRLRIVLRPDRQWQARKDAAFAKRMEAVRAELSDDDARRIAAEAEALEAESGTPNPPEAIAKLPQLKVTDLPGGPRRIPTAVERLDGGVELLRNDVFANGVNYVDLNFDLRGLPAELWQYLPRYTDAIRQLGAAGMNYEQIARRTAATTGGIACRANFTTHASDPNRPVLGLRVGMKALDDQVPAALELLGDLLFAVDPRDTERLRDVMVQARARYRTQLVHQGSGTAARHAARGLTPQGHLDELAEGLPQLTQADEIGERFDELGEELMGRIEAIRDFLLARRRLTVSFTGSDGACEALRGVLGDWIARMRDEPPADAEIGYRPFDTPPREGLAGPIQVAHCARVVPAPHYSDEDEPILALAAHLISYEYVLGEVRLKGNAYGAWCRHNSLGRVIEFGSYNDPHVARTLEVFDAAADYVQKADWTQTNVDHAIIGTAKRDEAPIRPAAATALAMYRHLTGQTYELRSRRYERIRAAGAADVRRAILDALAAGMPRAAVCVVAGREKLETANRQMPGRELAIEDILK